jgi:hypothetical protein
VHTGSAALAASGTQVQPLHMSEKSRQSPGLVHCPPASPVASGRDAAPSPPASAGAHERTQQHGVVQG